MKHTDLYRQAIEILPGGVNSPVRAFKAVGGNPIFAKRGKGAYFWDEEGKKYLDFCNSWGALLFGHAPASLIQTVSRDLKNGTSFGVATYKEVQLAEDIRSLFPSMEMLRLVSSGTEAVMSALRVARGFTGRDKVIKIDGGYHGHGDSFLVKAGSGGATFGVPDSAGIPQSLARETISVPFNDVQALEEVFKREGPQIAALVLEPVPANMGVILPGPGYLQSCREITRRYGALLIFDEVITGFRISKSGAQEVNGIKPDMTTLGKILGGGFPIAAFGGRRDIMEKLSPLGPVYQAGTLSGNPAAVSAALWMMKQLKTGERGKKLGVVDALNRRAKIFYQILEGQIRKQGFPVRLNSSASMFTLFFTPDPVKDLATAKQSDTKRFGEFFRYCLGKGIYLAPSQFEANFISTAHTDAQLKEALKTFIKGLEKIFK